MKAYQIKNNYRYVIYENEDTGEYYLVDAYEHRWITIFFPFLVWSLYYKSYPLTKEEFLQFKIKKKDEVSPLSVAGISLIASPMLVLGFDSSLRIPNIINGKLFYTIILIALIFLCYQIYMKLNLIKFDFKRDHIYMRICPVSTGKYIAGYFGYFIFLIFPLCILLPYGNNSHLLSIPFLSFSVICIFLYIFVGHPYMANNGPYDYKIKEIHD